MGEKKTFYAKLFSYLLKMLNKYYTNGVIPFDDRQEYEFVTGFHKDMQELLEMEKCRLTAVIYEVLCGTVQCRQLPYCSDPKGLLSEIWRLLAHWLSRPYDAELHDEIVGSVNAFCDKWKDQDIAINLIVIFAGEVETQKKLKKAVA